LLVLVELVELKAFPFIKEVNVEYEFDYAFIEGLVASESDLETVKKLREKTKVLIALCACAATGCVPAYRHFTLKENYAHLLYRNTIRMLNQPLYIIT
jgi:coenzyme F420-reducing hydrogenase gamma subunit